MRIEIKILLILIILFFGFYIFLNKSNKVPTAEKTTSTNSVQDVDDVQLVTTYTTDLDIPWALAFLPNGDLLVTERKGVLKLIAKNEANNPRIIYEVADVRHEGEGGLLGVTLHPNYEENNYIYLYYTFSSNGQNTLNRVVRYKLENNRISDAFTILNDIPGALFHNGGRMKFGPDGYLYITTGDAQEPSLSQNKSSLAGKVLRVKDNGDPAPGNPFNNEIYSYGHRNPQGLDWDSLGRLWVAEHGSSATDEINIVEAGKNYGWPTVRGDQTRSGLESPAVHSGSETWAPSGLAVVNDSIYIAGLRGQTLLVGNTGEANLKLTEHLNGQFGRLREVIKGPEGLLYVTTSNRDGRGNPKTGDDRILIINPAKL